ncbi:lysozyme inhibitor LprI family protein [Desulfovibrio sp. SGI.169]|uniref:lysozyme inhibitor LprI family protein n=1 Tax=Desulfovibrio sp. SGI.169 TaxID=3420561 RepID=UPI003D093012
MRLALSALVLLLALPAFAVAGENPLPAYEKQARALMEQCFERTASLSTSEASDLLTQSMEKADDLLNAAYKETIRNLKMKDAGLAEALRNDQRSWLKFTELFTEKAADGFGEGGTMYITMSISAKLRLFVERIAFLRIVNRNVVSEDSE